MDNLGTPVYRKAAKEHNNHKVVRKRRSESSCDHFGGNGIGYYYKPPMGIITE
jgi:hypothetical protein